MIRTQVKTKKLKIRKTREVFFRRTKVVKIEKKTGRYRQILRSILKINFKNKIS